jgi:hypothetical protein
MVAVGAESMVGGTIFQCPDAASLYARVDGIETNEGLVIVEIEQIEPALFLDDQTTTRFSHAILARCDFV